MKHASFLCLARRGHNKFTYGGYTAICGNLNICFANTDGSDETVTVYYKYGIIHGSISYSVCAEPRENKRLQAEGFHKIKGTLAYI